MSAAQCGVMNVSLENHDEIRMTQALMTQARILMGDRRFDEAARLFEAALAVDPVNAVLQCCLGLALKEQSRAGEALARFRRALALDPAQGQAAGEAGELLRAVGQADQALSWLARASRLVPGQGHIWARLGAAHQQLGAPARATEAYRRALCLAPSDDAGWHNLGNSLLQLGDAGAAQSYLRRALALSPDAAGLFHSLSQAVAFQPGDPAIAAMERLDRRRATLPPDARIRLSFALAKAYADCGEAGRGFDHLLAGNAEKRARTDYRESFALGLFDRLEDVPPGDFPAAAEPGPEAPIFVLGMPRSGSSLLEQILASHAGVAGAGEINLFGAAVHAVLGPRRFPDGVSTLTEADFARIGALYRSGERRLAGSGRRLVNKLPENFLLLGLIRRVLPDSSVIHARRAPLDTCLSCFSHLFAQGQAYSYDLGELGRYYRRYHALMGHWRAVLPSDSMIEVDYETLVADFVPEVRRLLASCGLAWDPACLAFHRTERPVMTGSLRQVRQPLYRTSVGKWRPPDVQIAPLVEALGDLIR